MGEFTLKPGTYLSLENEIVSITACSETEFPYCCYSTKGEIYTKSGNYFDGERREYDLIETLSHRLHRILCSATVPGLISTDDGRPYPLIDLLSDGDTIDGGFARCQSITEQILAGLFLEWEESKKKHPWPEGLTPEDWSDE